MVKILTLLEMKILMTSWEMRCFPQCRPGRALKEEH